MDLDRIRTHLKEELIPDNREHGKYLCPLCGSGEEKGSTHDGAFSIAPDGIHGKCFACGFYGDIFDLIAEKEMVSKNEATKILLDKYGDAAPAAVTFTQLPEDEPQQHDFSKYLADCHSSLKAGVGVPGFEYLRRRGITGETMDRFNLGYGQDEFGQPCIVMPHNTKGSYYTTRAVKETAGKPKHGKPKGVPAVLFNAAALYQPQPCFVVESQLCAISIMQEGGSAVALAGVAGKNLLLKQLDRQKPSAVLILCLDNDEPGQTAQEDLAGKLKEKKIPYTPVTIPEEYKDPNEYLMGDPAGLRQFIIDASQTAQEAREAASRQEKADYLTLTAAASFAAFEKYLDDNAGRPPVPTGFDSLDKILNGGLTAGLYIMGAISSLGKTSWMLNIADNIAAAGRDVLYFSLEMSSHELIAKSISRISFQLAGKNSRPLGEAFTTFEILNCRNRSQTMAQASALREAMTAYRETIGKHIWIFSGVSTISVDDIAQRVQDHIRITGQTPVVFIDYLQILAPEDLRSTDKQNTDRAVVKLKNMSATHDIPVFCISSLNRNNYTESINMTAFKESGAIEYGSDVLIGLQNYGMDRLPGEKKTAYETRIHDVMERAVRDPQTEIQVKVLKNRNGQRGGSGKLLFDKAYNSFHDVPEGFTSVYGDTTFEDEEDIPVI